jgi:hypothetical protein
MRMMSGPPASIGPHVLEFCAGISPGAQPVYLRIRPEASCEVSECFPNVCLKVEREGGRIQYGWEISEWPRVFIEAQHHAVYEGPGGPPWLDITPAPEDDQQDTRLFLPDDTAVYDAANPGVRRDNIRKALAADSLVDEFLGLAAEMTAIMNHLPGTGMVTVEGSDAERALSNAKRRSRLRQQLAMKYTTQGAPCFCGSGQKFKRCHGQLRKGGQ